MRLRVCGAALAISLLCTLAASAPAAYGQLQTDHMQPEPVTPHNQLTIDQLIDALGSPHYDERQQATELLKEQNLAFTGELVRILRTVQDLEVRLRLVEVAELLFYKDALKGVGGFLGIEMARARPTNRGADSDRIRGVRVQRVIPGTAAEKGDVRAGDVVIAIDGLPLLSSEDSTRDEPPRVDELNASLSRAISSVQPFDGLSLTILRNGNELTAKVTLGLKPLFLVRRNLALGRLGSDNLAALESARQEFTRWRAELEGSP